MFRLRRMLEWKRALERDARAERIAAERRMATLEEAIDRLRGLRDALPESPGAEGPAVIDELAQWARYAESLRERERRLRARVERFRPKLAAKVRAHVDLRREVKGLTRLEERALVSRRKLEERRRQEETDDAASRTNLPGPGNQFPSDRAGGRTAGEVRATTEAVQGVFDPNRGTRT